MIKFKKIINKTFEILLYFFGFYLAYLGKGYAENENMAGIIFVIFLFILVVYLFYYQTKKDLKSKSKELKK